MNDNVTNRGEISLRCGALKNAANGRNLSYCDAINEIFDNAVDANAKIVSIETTDDKLTVASKENHNLSMEDAEERIFKMGNCNKLTTLDNSVGRYGEGAKIAAASLVEVGNYGTWKLYGRPVKGKDWYYETVFDYRGDVFVDGQYIRTDNAEEIDAEYRNSKYDFIYSIDGIKPISKKEVNNLRNSLGVRYCDRLLKKMEATINGDKIIPEDVLYLTGPKQIKPKYLRFERKWAAYLDNPKAFEVINVDLRSASVQPDQCISYDSSGEGVLKQERSGVFIKYNGVLLNYGNPNNALKKLIGKVIQANTAGLRICVICHDKRAFEALVCGVNKSRVSIPDSVYTDPNFEELREVVTGFHAKMCTLHSLNNCMVKRTTCKEINDLLTNAHFNFSISFAKIGHLGAKVTPDYDAKTVIINTNSGQWTKPFNQKNEQISSVYTILRMMQLSQKENCTSKENIERFCMLLERCTSIPENMVNELYSIAV